MKAICVHRFGGPEVMLLEDVDAPSPGPGQLLVDVKVAGVGPWDAWVRAGKSVLDQPLPLIPGSDLAGVVSAVGAGVTNFKRGDEVFGVTAPSFTGAYAQRALAQASMMAKKPKELSFAEAASAPVVAVTALQMLFEHGGLKPKQRVLIHGAGGSVGACAAQFALEAGATVLGTCTTRDYDYVRSLGLHTTIDSSLARFEEALAPVDLVIDTVGGELQERSLSVLKRGGALISAVSQPDPVRAAEQGVRAEFILVQVRTADLERVARSMVAGTLKLRIAGEFPLSDARIMHEMLDASRPRPAGKLLLVPTL